MATLILSHALEAVKRRVADSANDGGLPVAGASLSAALEAGGEAVLEAIERALDGAHGGRALDEISATVWKAHGAGLVADDEAHVLLERIAARRAVGAARKAESARAAPCGMRPSRFPPRRPQRPRNRADLIARRRRVAASGSLPPSLAVHFTLAETAVLAVVVAEVRERGRCALALDALAARAGCSRSSARNAIRSAEHLRLLRRTLRPRRGAKNDTNVIEIVSVEWRDWIAHGPAAPIALMSGDRAQNVRSHEYSSLSRRRAKPSNTVSMKPETDRNGRRRSSSG